MFKEEDIVNVKNIIRDIDECLYDLIPSSFHFHIIKKNIKGGKLIINNSFPISYICRMYFDLDEFYSKCEEKNIECIFISDTYDNCIKENHPVKQIEEINL